MGVDAMNVLDIAKKCGSTIANSNRYGTRQISFLGNELYFFAAEIRKQTLLEASEIDIGCDCCSTQESLELLTEYRGILIAMANKAVK